jgi:hypothetical protein
MWMLFSDPDEVIDWLMKEVENEYREHIIKRYHDLAEKVKKFHDIYFSGGEDVLLGYAIVITYDVFIKAITAYGEHEPIVETIDIEEWLEDYEQAVGGEQE